MKILEKEKTNCGWFIRYETFDWVSLLSFALLMVIPLYGAVVGIQNINHGHNPVISWIMAVIGTIVLLFILLGFILLLKDHKFWFTTKEKFVRKITIPFNDR